MAKDSERETLIDLFSTRQRTQTSSGLIEGPAQTPATVSSSGEVAQRGAAKPSAPGGAPVRAPLSPVANAILREARKELGSAENFEDEDDISEENIARAVDKVCASRG